MAITVVLICLAIQRYVFAKNSTHQYDWMTPYFTWLKDKVPQITTLHGLAGVAILVLPILIAVSLVFVALILPLLGFIGYYAASVALLWYCVDSRDLRKNPHPVESADDVFKFTYQHLFGVIFWFFLLGAVGVALYATVAELRRYLEQRHDPETSNLLAATLLVQGVLDWVPVRLLGLSFALVGNFSAVFRDWFKELFSGFDANFNNLTRWGNAALTETNRKPMEPVTPDKAIAVVDAADDVADLLDRTLLLWLVVMAIFTIGFWIGLL